ncbi:M48 family metallopeptidase [Aestuariibius sp. 2305UL40-4]|uniref:M48 family metallopeptidase n=1 Tax=Aestuariibius violaceus TaxID=3234132 RepID=UPI00345EB715
MIRLASLLAASLVLVAACAPVGPTTAPAPAALPQPQADRIDLQTATRNFAAVVRRVEPVAESYCRQRQPTFNCDFLIVVDDRPGVPANAFQTLDRNGRPVIGFTLALIADTRNQDEIAFVMSHEAAHHIEGHLARQRQAATVGATVLGQLATTLGDSGASVRTAQQLGAAVGARTFSKEFELEADALGTVITARAGYDPLRGAAFFSRIPDPGDRFLGTHPPNAERMATVQRVAAGL